LEPNLRCHGSQSVDRAHARPLVRLRVSSPKLVVTYCVKSLPDEG
jgi:hypothetical protein